MTGGTAGRIVPNEELMLQAAKFLLPTGWDVVEREDEEVLDVE